METEEEPSKWSTCDIRDDLTKERIRQLKRNSMRKVTGKHVSNLKFHCGQRASPRDE